LGIDRTDRVRKYDKVRQKPSAGTTNWLADRHRYNVYCELPPEALAIIKSMPRGEPEIFPYSTDAISAAFTRACKILGIEDLRFHDLRHEGISRLFEMGRTIPQVAAVSGHRSWTSLKRYTHIRQSEDKYDHWKWKVHLAIEWSPAASVLKFNGLQGPKSRSSIIQNAIRTELDTGRQWERVISSDLIVKRAL
jgi:integrase